MCRKEIPRSLLSTCLSYWRRRRKAWWVKMKMNDRIFFPLSIPWFYFIHFFRNFLSFFFQTLSQDTISIVNDSFLFSQSISEYISDLYIFSYLAQNDFWEIERERKSRKEIFYECWQAFSSIVLSIFRLRPSDIDHLPSTCTYPLNESENLYVNTIGKLFFFLLLLLALKYIEIYLYKKI